MDNAIHWINLYPLDSAILVSLILIHSKEIYPMDGSIQLLNNWGLASVVQRLDSTIHQAPVVQTLDSAIRRINNYPADKYYGN